MPAPGEEVVGKKDVVAIGASAGGLRALTVVLTDLSDAFPAPILIVQHLDPRYESHMANILSRRTTMRVVEAKDGDRIEAGAVYIAPPGRHMLVEKDHIRLTTTELVHFSRPSVDLLFESVAAAYGSKAVGVILTGSGSDGSLGIRAIKETDGLTIAQDPETAENSVMPHTAIATGAVDMVLPLEEIAQILWRVTATEEEDVGN